MARRENMTEADIAAQIRLKKIWDEKHKALGLSQTKLAAKYAHLGINQSMISNCLNGNQGISSKMLLIFKNELQVSEADIRPEFFPDSGQQKPDLTPEDQAFLELYNQAPEDLRETVKSMLRVYLAKHQPPDPS